MNLNEPLLNIGDRRLLGSCFGIRMMATVTKIEAPEESNYGEWTYHLTGDDGIIETYFNADFR